MERVNISASVSFSRIVYGMWRIGDDADTSPEHVTRKISACLDQSITTFDLADIYGDYTAEEIAGNALRANPGLREKMEIVTKCDIVAPIGKYSDKPVKYYDTSAAHINASLESSLQSLGTDYVDLLLIHRPDPLMDHNETGAVLDALVQSGKVRSVGVSNFRPWDCNLLQSAMKTPLATNQIEMSLGEVSSFSNGDIAFHQQHDTPLMAWSPLGGGALMTSAGLVGERMDQLAEAFGVDRAAIAVAFLLRHPAKILPVLGTNNLSRIEKLTEVLKPTLSREDWFGLYEAALGHEVP